MNIYEEKAIIHREAARFGVSPEVIWGIYGKETAFGKNQTTSSAGAKGPYQFIESTAHQYKYPYTNAKSQKLFEEQTESTAWYLSSLLHSSGRKGASAYQYAIHAYSGGGYSYNDVIQEARNNPLGSGAHEGIEELQGPLGPGEGVGGSTQKAFEKGFEEGPGGLIPSIPNPIKGIEGFFSALGEAKTWLRVAEGVGGLVLIYLGIAELTHSHPVGQAIIGDAKKVGKVVK